MATVQRAALAQMSQHSGAPYSSLFPWLHMFIFIPAVCTLDLCTFEIFVVSPTDLRMGTVFSVL